MRFFEKYTSATVAGGGNQHIFYEDNKNVCTGRIFYKHLCPGKHTYSLLYSNIIDSTFSDGSESHKNIVCDSWDIIGIRVGKAKECNTESFGDITDFITLTFNGSESREVNPGEFFCTDPFEMAFEYEEYMCVEISFAGRQLPYHAETLLPAFRLENGKWKADARMPFPSMIGVKRTDKLRIGFLGDSITQGIGTKPNSYAHWNALVSESLGDKYAYWNLGLGFGRADDAASDGAWLFKAKQNDFIVLCYGVNDILKGYSAESIRNNLRTIILKLHQSNVRVLIQTVPPFDYGEEHKAIWLDVNNYIREELSKIADGVFDTVPVLGRPEPETNMSLYGGHPDERGCRAWADKLVPVIKDMLSK